MRIQSKPGLLAIICLFMSCERQALNIGEVEFAFGNGVFVVNEGQFLASNASISFYDPDTDSVQNQVFYRSNQVPLGDVAHSMEIWEDEAFIVVNNSGRIYRTGLNDMKFRSKITGLVSPRYIKSIRHNQSVKSYISDLYSGKILIFNPLTATLLDSIDISRTSGGTTPGTPGSAALARSAAPGISTSDRISSERMILHDGKLYVACWSYGNQILVIDTSTDEMIDSIEVGKQPNSMVVDREENLWVLSDGGYPYSPAGQEYASLSRIDLSTHTAETIKIWEDIRVSPTDLCINPGGDSLYFINGGIFKVSTGMEGFSEPLISGRGREFYSLGVDPAGGRIYIGDAVDYQQDGWVYSYMPGGALIDSFRVGVNPGYFCFSTRRQQ